MPPEVAPWLFTDGPAQGFDPADFVSRVARPEDALVQAYGRSDDGARQALDDDAYRYFTARLPRTFAPLLPKGEFAGGVPADSFVLKIADRAGLDPAQALRGRAADLAAWYCRPRW